MKKSIHTPERLAGESQSDYRARQRASRRAVREIQAGTPLRDHFGSGRRLAVKAAGGIRQYKRARSAPLRALRDATRF